ncbi:MAG: class I SAM-dependent methyltransferase [Chthoniobacterales bacterium]|nr:class I SAM-dependent methyltransferase [Chthoniobacterales bacterium]
MIDFIRNRLKDSRLINVNYDGEDRIRIHNEILCQKKMMQGVFEDFYQLCVTMADKYFCNEGEELEIGSGVSFFKKIRPNLITSDIINAPHLNIILDAQNMSQIKDSSLRSIYAINVFHHFSDPRQFFSELLRVLKPGGGCVLVEPFYGLIAKKFYSNVHQSEHFNPFQKEWESTSDMGIMSNANQALSYIVFKRDREIFEKEYPTLNIVESNLLYNYLRYFFSGGINFKQLLPNISIPILKMCESLLRPFAHYTALHHIIAIKKD